MQQGRVSTIRFNEWICVCAQYEKAVARIGRQVYQGYSRGLVSDFGAVELCKEISQAFSDSKQIRADMEEEMERDALRGLSLEEAKLADEVVELTAGDKAIRSVKLTISKLMGRRNINNSLQSYRDRVRELSRDLGLRALALHTKEPLLRMEGHMRLCQLAVKLDEDSNQKWEEITKGKSDKGGMNISFHTLLISFFANFANFSKGTAIGKVMLKFLKYDSREEEKKLHKQFEGSKTAEALEAQMAEVEEPDSDIGREMALMERDYVDTPTDWGLPPKANEDSWIPDTSDTWAPGASASLIAPAKAAPVSPPPMPPKPTDGPKPQVLRQRRTTDALQGAESWTTSQEPVPQPEPEESWAPPAGAARLGNMPVPTASSAPVEDWATEVDDDDDEIAPGPATPRLGGGVTQPDLRPPNRPGPPQIGTSMPPKQAARPGTPPSAPPAPTSAPPDQPSALPPITPPRPAASAGPPGLGAPGRGPASEIPLPPLPPLPSRPIRSLEIPAASAIPVPPLTPPPAPTSDDPLLRLLRNDPIPELKSDDDLLPAFLRERNDDDSLDTSTSFIPDLPDSVDSGLKILPFGSQPKKPDDDIDTFIPQMPD